MFEKIKKRTKETLRNLHLDIQLEENLLNT